MYQFQEDLIRHLCRYNILSYNDCLHALDPCELHTPTERSYIFRPLTRQGYLQKRDDRVTVLAKGRALYPELEPLVTLGGGKTNMERLMQVSRMAMLLNEIFVPSYGELRDRGWFYFVPSARWRDTAPGILSTTRFVGMLILHDRRYAVYDIGDGKMEWQARAEGSLFYTRRGSHSTRATGMVFVCSDDKRIEVAQQIIRQTMWYRKRLLKNDRIERDRPTRWSRSPIRLKADYKHVYLTTPKTLEQSIMRIYGDISPGVPFALDARREKEPSQGDYVNWPYRYFCNPACDLLKFVYFFSAAKNLMELRESELGWNVDLRYAICVRREDLPILEMYPDVMTMEGLKIYEYTNRFHAETDSTLLSL